jgi:phage gp36-like protein
MAYATPAQLLARFDARTLGQLVRDDGVQASAAELLTDDNLQAALDDASGEIDAVLFQGGRYTPDQLAALTGNAQAYLIRMTCLIALRHLFDRRPSLESTARDEATEQARKMLDRLRKGENVFNLTPDDPTDDANTPEFVQDTPSSVRPLNTVVDACRGRYYPERRYRQ